MHLHFSLLQWIMNALDFILFIIPLKLVAANFVGKSNLANALYAVV